MKEGIIYKATNTINDQVYIGVTTQKLRERIKDHICKSNKDYNFKFQKAILEYGEENFLWEQIDTTQNSNEMAEKERYYIDLYDSFRNGYNSDSGGGIQKYIYQYKSTGELINTFKSLEEASSTLNTAKSSISHACLLDIKTCKGYVWSYNTTFNVISDNRKKSVFQYDIDGGFIQEFESISIAGQSTNINKSSIAKCCRGERKTAGGFIWKFYN
jgi:group I intron endonuclease